MTRNENARPTNSHTNAQAIAALTLVLLLVGGGLAAWRRPRHPQASGYAELLLDVSPSVERSEECDDVRRIAEEIIQRPGMLVLTLWTTSDAKHGNFPIRLGTITRARSATLAEARGAGAKDAAFVRQAMELCRTAKPAGESPIFHSLAAVLASIKEKSCGQPETFCAIWVRSDLGDPLLDQVLLGQRKARLQLDNRTSDEAGITINFCGVNARRLAGRVQPPPTLSQLEDAVRSFFTYGKRVHVQAACAAFHADKVQER